MIIYYIGFMSWVLSLCSILTNLEKNKQPSSLLKFIQLYNFLTGFLGYFVFFISTIFFLFFFKGSNIGLVFASIFVSIPLLLLILPINAKVKKKINMNTIGYIVLSVTMLLLGFVTFIISEKYIIELIG